MTEITIISKLQDALNALAEYNQIRSIINVEVAKKVVAEDMYAADIIDQINDNIKIIEPINYKEIIGPRGEICPTCKGSGRI